MILIEIILLVHRKYIHLFFIHTFVSLQSLRSFFLAFPASLFAETCRTGFWKATTFRKKEKEKARFFVVSNYLGTPS